MISDFKETSCKESDNMSAKCKKVDEAVISSPDFVSISPLIKNNGNVLKMSRTSNLIPVVTDIFGEASIMDCITNRSHFARKDYLEIDLQLSNAEAFGNLSENMDVIDVHLYKCSSSYQQENAFLSNLDMIKKETDRTMLRIRLLIMEASKLSSSLKSITVEYSNLIERIQEDYKCCEPPLVVFINNKYGDNRAENEIVTLHGSQEGMMSPRKDMDDHTCVVQNVSLAFDAGGMNKRKSIAEEIRKVSKERPWMAGTTEWLVLIMTSFFHVFTSGKRLFQGIPSVSQVCITLILFFFVGVKSFQKDLNCSVKATVKEQSGFLMLIVLNNCSKGSERWEKFTNILFLGGTRGPNVGHAYELDGGNGSSTLSIKIQNESLADMYQAKYKYTKGTTDVAIRPSDMIVLANYQCVWDITCNGEESVLGNSITIKHPYKKIGVKALLRHRDQEGFSQSLDAKVLTTEWNGIMYESQVIINGTCDNKKMGFELDIEVHEVNKTQSFTEPVKANTTQCQANNNSSFLGSSVAIIILVFVVGICVTCISCIYARHKGWLCFKRKKDYTYTRQDDKLEVRKDVVTSLVCPKLPDTTIMQWLKYIIIIKVTKETYVDWLQVNRNVEEHS